MVECEAAGHTGPIPAKTAEEHAGVAEEQAAEADGRMKSGKSADGQAGGRGRKKNPSDITNRVSRGTNASYLVRRIARHHPDILERMKARPFYEAEAKKRQEEAGKTVGRGRPKNSSASKDTQLSRKAGDRGRASTAVGKRFNVSATSVDRARENMMEWGTSAEVEHETVRATVEAYARGEIELPAPVDDVGDAYLRYAPSYIRGAIPPKQRSTHPYTPETLTTFVGYSSYKTKQILQRLEIIEKQWVTEQSLKNLSTKQALVCRGLGGLLWQRLIGGVGVGTPRRGVPSVLIRRGNG